MKATSRAHRQTNVNTYAMAWVQRYFIAVGLVALGCAKWKYHLYLHTPKHDGKSGFQTFELLMDSGSYVLTVVLLLFPWWRLGDIITALGYAIVLPVCTYVLVGLSIVDLVYVHQQTLFHFFLLSGVLAQLFWLFLRLRAESRQAAIAHLWKERLRQKHQDKIELVERFILEIEGEDRDITRGSRFADVSRKDDPTAMWKRLDAEWEGWLSNSIRPLRRTSP